MILFAADSAGSTNDPTRLAGHNFSNIVASGQSKIHNGDVYHNQRYFYSYNYYCAEPPTVLSVTHNLCTELIRGGRSSLKRKRSFSNEGRGHRPDDHSLLEEAIYKLGKLSDKVVHSQKDEQEGKVARQIQVLLSAIKQKRHNSEDEHTEPEFDRLGARALAAESIKINEAALRMTSRNVVQVDRKIDTIKIGQWVISLTTTTRHCRNKNGLDVIDSLSKLSLDVDRSKRSYLPGPSLTISFGRNHINRSLINPVVSAYRCVSYESEVFTLIERDDVHGLKMLLAEGKAALRDCDQANKSLLLISKGTD